MKKTTVFFRFLCVFLVAVMTLGLCACPAGEPSDGTTGSSTTTGNSQNQNPDDVTDATYADGAPIEGAGATLAEGSFASTSHTPDEANAIEISTMSWLFRGSNLLEGATYILTADTPSAFGASSKKYDGQGAVIIAPHGVVIEGAYDFVLKNITVIGSLTIKGSSGVRLECVEVCNASGTALTVSSDTDGVVLKDCRLSGKQAALNAAKNFTVISSAILAEEKGILDSGAENSAYAGCVFKTGDDALTVAAGGAEIRGNSFELPATATAITLQGAGVNNLIALNSIKTAQTSIKIDGATNTSVVLNAGITVIAENATSLYVCDNSLGGRIRVKNNNYLLVDGNTFPEGDGLDHTSLQADNQNTNGDNITDVDERLDAGVNEALLPHVNYDLYHGMPRAATVTVGGEDTGKRIGSYILAEAAGSSYVVLKPGAYAVTGGTSYGEKHSGTTVYSYGVYVEMERGTYGNLGNHIVVNGADKISIKGMTLGFERQSCGQVYVLAKQGTNRLLVVTGAGMDNAFGNTDTSLYNVTGMGAQRAGTFYAYCDTSFNNITVREDGLMEMIVSGSVFQMIEEGDILTCRSLNGGSTVSVSKSTDILFKDVTLYGNSGGLACYEGANRTAVTYYRMANTTKSAPIIDEETYNYYRALEEQYGVSLEVYVDDLGRFRGSPPHIGSIDATHVVGCAQGSVAISCLFENMCDDATNQHAMHARLDSLTDNGDGTATVVYKGNYSRVDYDTKTTGAGGYCQPFIVGDRVYIYTSAGKLVCDTTALTATATVIEGGKAKTAVNEDRYNRTKSTGGTRANCTFTYYSITIPSDAVNFDALNGYQLELNSCDDTHKVIVDNMSMASNGFVFDNCLSQNIRSRGLLIKASEGQIVNCTFRNIGMACAAILYEIYWGESGVSENLVVARNVMDHTGYFIKYTSGNEDRYSPISIEGLGSRVEEDYLLYKNIQITDNIILNRTTKYAVYVNSARDILIKGNSFGDYVDGESDEHFTRAVHINGAMDVEISGNIYSSLDLSVQDYIVAEHNKNIFGTDVVFDGIPVIPDSE